VFPQQSARKDKTDSRTRGIRALAVRDHARIIDRPPPTLLAVRRSGSGTIARRHNWLNCSCRTRSGWRI